MSKPPADRRSGRFYGLLVLLVVALSAVAAGLFAFAPRNSSEAERLVRTLSQIPVDGQRFFDFSSFNESSYSDALVDAEVLSLTNDDARLRTFRDVARGNLPAAVAVLSKLAEGNPSDPALINDLGVVYWGLGKKSPSNYFKALQLFERSAHLAPQAIAPRLNMALGYDKLDLHELASKALRHYDHLEKSSLWSRELSDLSDKDSLHIRDLQQALAVKDETLAKELLHRHPDTYRTMALESALHPAGVASDKTVEFILEYFGTTQDDATMRAILAPLGTESRNDILAARKLVSDGIKAYFRSDFAESLGLYDLADASLTRSGSAIDQLWLKLNRADCQLRSARSEPVGRQIDIAAAIRLLDEVISKSKELKLNWILGQALISKGVASATTRNQDEIMLLFNEGLTTLQLWGTPKDTARPLYYLAVIHSLAGDSESSLDLAYRSLKVTHADDHVRLTQLYWLIGREVYRLGYGQYAVPLARQAVDEAVISANSGLVGVVVTSLATMQVHKGAEEYLTQAESARDRMKGAAERQSLDLAINLLCGQIRMTMGNLHEAETCLKRNLEILKLEARAAPDLFPQTLLGLAQINTVRGDFNTARQQLRAATEVIEINDAYLATAALRMPFENQRRNLYDSAITFEYDHGGEDAAWSYIQRYRSKLFLEFLRQTNPAVVGTLDRAVDRSRMQSVLPDDVQVLEYVLLKDRLLVWLISKSGAVSVAVPVTRADLESRVSDFIASIGRKEEVTATSENLYKLLIEPIESRLDPDRALAIIPDQALHRLNFAALRSAASKQFLIQKYTILESPNLATLLSGTAGSPSRKSAFSFGARMDNTGATRELRDLTRFYPDMKSFNGETAVKESFLSSLSEASIFHYAAHSQDAADPLRSAILLDGEREGPNSVTAVDISRRRMPANSVVVLASCDSSVGNSRDGIGMRGLTSAFLISGAGSVVGSLWLVEADSTSRLVLDFHRNFVSSRLPVAVALRQAQLSFINEGVHPYYWSGFVVTGNISALR